MSENNVTSKKLTAGIIILVILSIALCITDLCAGLLHDFGGKQYFQNGKYSDQSQ